MARELVLQGHAVRVLEATDRAGGQVHSVELDGLQVDVGAAHFLTDDGVVRAYLDRIGIADRVVMPLQNSLWLHAAEGETTALPDASLLGIPATPMSADTIRVVGRGAALRALLDALLPGPVGAKAPTLGALVRRRMGDGILERLVAPVVEAERSVHPDDLPMTQVPGLVHHLLRENSLGRAVARMTLEHSAGTTVASLTSGMSGLVDALLAELDRFGVSIEYGARVAEVHPDHVVFASEEGVDSAERPERSGLIVVAAPGLVGAGDGDDAASLAAPHVVHIVTLVLAADEGSEQGLQSAPRGAGVLVARAAVVQARVLEHVSATWPPLAEAAAGRHVVRLRYENLPSVEQARLDAEVLLGVSIPTDRILATTTTSWRPAARIVADDRIRVVGEQVAGAEIAAVIAHARSVALDIGAPSAPPGWPADGAGARLS